MARSVILALALAYVVAGLETRIDAQGVSLIGGGAAVGVVLHFCCECGSRTNWDFGMGCGGGLLFCLWGCLFYCVLVWYCDVFEVVFFLILGVFGLSWGMGF